MAHVVEILPSGHRIENQGAESVLQSALDAGLAVDYGCSNGNCGKCRARLVGGEISRIAHSDFVFDRREAGQGWFLMCRHAAASDIVIDTGVARGSADIEWQEIDLKVRRVAPLDERTVLLHLQTPRTRRLRFLAGQWARLSLGGLRCELPIASCPCDDRNIDFHVPLEGASCAGAVALAALRPGAGVHLGGPFGDFVLDAESPRGRVMIGADGGLVPLKSIIEHSLALAPGIPVTLLFAERHGQPHYLRNLFRSWCDALDSFMFELADRDRADGGVGDFLRASAADSGAVDFYLCGEQPFVAGVRAELDDLGVPAERIRQSAA